jgi:hypothetical protein
MQHKNLVPERLCSFSVRSTAWIPESTHLALSSQLCGGGVLCGDFGPYPLLKIEYNIFLKIA